MEIITCKNHPYDGPKIMVRDTQFPNRVARLAEHLLDKALVMGAPGGEDSAGRAMIRPAEVLETVERAFDIAEAYFIVAQKRGHLLVVPEPTDAR